MNETSSRAEVTKNFLRMANPKLTFSTSNIAVDEVRNTLLAYGEKDPTKADILHRRYVEKKSLKKISDEVGYSVWYVYHLHLQALEEAYPFVKPEYRA